jgi:dicarboxylate transporter 10
MTYSLVRIGSYEEIKRLIAKVHPPSTGELLLAASVAGGLGGVAGNPAGKYVCYYEPMLLSCRRSSDILLVRMTSDPVRPPDMKYGYSNVFRGLVSLLKEDGLRGLTRGMGVNSTRAVLMNVRELYLSILQS